MYENCTCREGTNIDWDGIIGIERDIVDLIKKAVNQKEKELMPEPRTLLDVKELFMNFVPSDNAWIASTLFDQLCLICTGANLNIDVLCSNVPDEIAEELKSTYDTTMAKEYREDDF